MILLKIIKTKCVNMENYYCHKCCDMVRKSIIMMLWRLVIMLLTFVV